MDHTTDEQLQSFLDREDSDIERAAVMRHLGACAPCRDRLESLEVLSIDVGGAVGLLRPPRVARPTFAVLEARARAVEPAAPTADVATPPAPASSTPAVRPASARLVSSWLRAAAVVLAVAGAASATTIVVQRGAVDRTEPAAAAGPEQAAPAVTSDAQVARSGVSVMPSAGRIVVAVRGAAAGTTIDVGVAEASAASAFVRGDGEGIRFSAQTGRIDVDATGRAIALDVRLPTGATAATVEVDGRVRARKVDGRVRLERGDSDVTVRASARR